VLDSGAAGAASSLAHTHALSLQETAGRHYAGYPRTARADASVATPEAKSGDAFVAVGLARDAALPTTTGAAVAVLPAVAGHRCGAAARRVAIVREDRLPAAPGSGEDADDVSRQPGMGAQLVALARSVWAYRELLQQITLRDVRIPLRAGGDGFGWAVLMPAIIVGAGILVRSAMAYVSGSQIETTEIYGLALRRCRGRSRRRGRLRDDEPHRKLRARHQGRVSPHRPAAGRGADAGGRQRDRRERRAAARAVPGASP